MKNIQREDIHIISRHVSLSEKGISKALTENVYNSREAWQKFFRLFFISLGIGFTVSGIISFFAYNWADMHRYAKIGLVELLIIITTALALFAKINISIKNIILTGASGLAGVLFALFGQIYQTGANAYDFFLVWTLCITLWVLVSNFAPLWLLYLVLINTTLVLYHQQTVEDWFGVFILTLLFIINAIVLIIATIISKYKKITVVPDWFLNTLFLAVTIFATIGIILGIFDHYWDSKNWHMDDSFLTFLTLVLLTAIVFTLGILHSIKIKSGFYFAIIPFSVIIIVSALLVDVFDSKYLEMIFLLISIFIISGVTLTIKNLIRIQKKWANEK